MEGGRLAEAGDPMVSTLITRPHVLHALPLPMLCNVLPILAYCCLTYVPVLLVGVAHRRNPGAPRGEHSDAALCDAECVGPLGDP